jgi:hypothetical protein
MIKYDLRCDQDHTFEVWFRDSATCDEQLADGEVLCPQCASPHVQKALMAPSVAKSPLANSRSADSEQEQQLTVAHYRHLLREMRRHVEANSDHVGADFPEEARRMHYGEAERRSIYGEADLTEAKELIDEGIDIMPLPGPIRDDA